jgi:anti-anti-sigma factor
MLQLKRDIRMIESRPVGFLNLQGYLDSMDSMKLERAIDEIYAQDVFDIILDVSHVSHISSAGWSVVVSKLSLLGEKRGYFRFVGMRPEVEHVFHMVGFDFIQGIELHEDFESALRACRGTVVQ